MAKPADTEPAASTTLARYWIVAVVRAAIAAVAALVVTFSADHSAPVGLTVFGCFGIVTGVVIAGHALVWFRGDRVATWSFVVQGIVTVAAAIVALIFAASGTQLPALYATVIAWGLISGALELYSGFRARRSAIMRPVSRDWMTVGAITVLLAVTFLLVPPGLNQQLGGVEQVQGVLTSSIILVGVFGAYAAIVAVYLTIGGLSLKWSSDPRRSISTPAGNHS